MANQNFKQDMYIIFILVKATVDKSLKYTMTTDKSTVKHRFIIMMMVLM